MKIDKYIITTVIFILIISFIGIITFWNNRNQFLDILKSGDIINKTNEIYSKDVAFSDEFIDLWSQTQVVSNVQLLEDAEYGVIVKDGTGNLYFPADKVDVTNQANKVKELSNLLKEKNTPFIYIQAPNKMVEGYSEKIVYEYNFANQNADDLILKLDKMDIDTLDLRKLITKDNLDKETLFYKTDHHWTTPTSFWAYTKLVSNLNEKYKLQIDENNFYRNIDNYNIRTIENCFLGALGRRVGKSVAGLDDYIFIEPKFDTNYEIYNGVISIKDTIFSGSFQNAIVRAHILNSTDVLSNKHGTYFEWDYGDLIIKNKSIDNETKILLIKDSYALPVVAFLSTCVSEVRMVDLRDSPSADLKTILKNEKFDVVMLMYNAEAVHIENMFKFNIYK